MNRYLSQMIHIHQDGRGLGAYNLEAVTTGLQAGTFRSDAWAWHQNMKTWRPIQEVVYRQMNKQKAISPILRSQQASQTYRLL